MEMKTHKVSYLPIGVAPCDLFDSDMKAELADRSGQVAPTFNGGLKMKLAGDKDYTATTSNFIKAVKAHRKGVDNHKELTFRCNPSIIYVGITEPDKVTVDLNFRFAGCKSIGSHNGRMDKRTVTFPTPPFYFKIRIRRDRSQRQLISGYNILKFRDGKVFPHGSGGNNSGFCFGGMTDQMMDTITHDDLTMLLDVFTLYLQSGTDIDDSYGSGWHSFNDKPDRVQVEYGHIKGEEIKLFAVFDKEMRDKVPGFSVSVSGEDEMKEFIATGKRIKAQLKSLGIQ